MLNFGQLVRISDSAALVLVAHSSSMLAAAVGWPFTCKAGQRVAPPIIEKLKAAYQLVVGPEYSHDMGEHNYRCMVTLYTRPFPVFMCKLLIAELVGSVALPASQREGACSQVGKRGGLIALINSL